MADTPAFPTPKPVEAPPSAAAASNPATPIVRDALGKGWLQMQSADEKAAGTQRSQVNRAGTALGLRVRTRQHKQDGKVNPRVWYFKVERKSDSQTASG